MPWIEPCVRATTGLLLRWLPADLRDSIAGDLDEEYRALRDRHGGLRAATWWCCQAARLAITFRVERLIAGRPIPPIADHPPRGITMWDSIQQDVQFGLRVLRRQPGFTAVALLALAIGIGATTSIFSIVDAVLWRPLPFAQPDRIASLGEQRPREGRLHGPVSPADFFDWRKDSRSFVRMAAYGTIAMNLTGGAEPLRLRAAYTTAGFLDVLGIAPALGRGFRAEEESPGRQRIVLLGDSLWRRAFGANAAIVGRMITIDDQAYEVVGVLPGSFWWPGDPELMVPLALNDHDRQLRGAHFLEVIGRLAPGMSMEQGREEMAVIGRRLSEAYPAENAHHAPSVRALHGVLVGDVRTGLLVLLGGVMLVLLGACANVATLLLARAVGRQKELAIRGALGAARGRLVRQLLVESMVLALLGGVAGVLLATVCLAACRALLPVAFATLPGIDRIGIDPRVMGLGLVLSCASAVIHGALPAVVSTDRRIAVTLNMESRGGSGHARSARVRAMLVVAELALSVVLLVSALLMVSLRNVTDVWPGFRAQQLMTLPLSLSSSRYPEHAQVTAFYSALFERLKALPGVQQVAATSAPPFSGLDSRLDLQVRDRIVSSTGPVRVRPRLVSAAYLPTMGIPLMRGRHFSARDDGTAGDVAIVNQAAVRQYWPDSDPLGQQISLGDPVRWMTVVGVAGNIRHGGLDAEPEPEAYMPLAQGFVALGAGLERNLTVLVRATSDPAMLAPLIRSAVQSVDAHQPVGALLPMDELIARSVAPRKLNSVLLATFAVIAVVLAAGGLYGVMAYLVGQRTREIGVRMALGASRGQVVALVLRQAGAMTIAGIGIGIVGALALTRLLATLLFGVSATDPLVYVAVSALLGAIALIAVAIPSSRATRVDPLTALR